MIRRPGLLGCLLLLAACGAEQHANPPCLTAVGDSDAGLAAVGEQAYTQACARCHDEGANDAPRIGDKDAWAGRSWLWEAVLFEHANKGYLDMPAKGGDESLDDATVARAAEYMLCVTFPDTPRD